MNIPGRVEAAVKGLVLWAGVGLTAAATALAGLGFLIAAMFIWLEHFVLRAAAAAITGGVLIALALIGVFAGRAFLRKIQKPQPPLLAEFGGLVGAAGRLAGLVIRRDPRKAMVLAVIAGAVADYLTSSGNPKGKS